MLPDGKTSQRGYFVGFEFDGLSQTHAWVDGSWPMHVFARHSVNGASLMVRHYPVVNFKDPERQLTETFTPFNEHERINLRKPSETCSSVPYVLIRAVSFPCLCYVMPDEGHH